MYFKSFSSHLVLLFLGHSDTRDVEPVSCSSELGFEPMNSLSLFGLVSGLLIEGKRCRFCSLRAEFFISSSAVSWTLSCRAAEPMSSASELGLEAMNFLSLFLLGSGLLVEDKPCCFVFLGIAFSSHRLLLIIITRTQYVSHCGIG